jgi:hypothetical protein
MQLRGRRVFVVGTASLLAASAQGLGLVQILLLLLGRGAGTASDAYFFLTSWNQVPAQIILMGMMYPLWLRGSTIRRATQNAWLASVPVLSVVATIVAGFLFSRLSGTYTDLVLHTALLCGIGIAASLCWAISLRLSSEGHPNWLAAMTLSANIASCLSLVAAQGLDVPGRVTAMLIGQLFGMVVYLAILVTVNRSQLAHLFDPTSTAVAHVLPTRTDGAWFLGQSVAGYGSNLVLQTQTAQLPANALTVVGIIARVLSGLNSLLTNAIMPRLLHRTSASGDAVYAYLRKVFIAVVSVAAILIVIRVFVHSDYLAIGLVIVAWFMAAAMSASMKRIAIKSLPPAVAIANIAICVSIPIAVVGIGAFGGLSLPLILSAYVGLDLLSGAAYGLLLRRWMMTAIYSSTAILLLITAVILLSR